MRREAPRSAGLTAEQRRELRDLHRDVTMLRVGAKLRISGRRKLWWGRCEHCRREGWLERAHIEPVGRVPHMEFDPDNAVALLYNCHRHWAHNWPALFDAWITLKIGHAARRVLTLRARATDFRPEYGPTRLHLLACRAKYRGQAAIY